MTIKGSCDCGAVEWQYSGTPSSANACNCTICRRYGGFWAYGCEGEEITISGPTTRYLRGDKMLGFHFCTTCGNLAYWRGLEKGEDGRMRMAVNLRLAEPEDVADIPLNRFDGLDTFTNLGADGRCIKDNWF